MQEFLLTANSDEYSRAGRQVGENYGARLFFNQAMLLGYQWIIRENEIANGRPDLQRVSPSNYLCPIGPAFEHLNDAKGRGPFRRGVKVRRIRVGTVVWDRVCVHTQELVPNDELVTRA